MLLEEIKKIPSTEKDLKKFGITIGLVLIVVTLVMIYYSNYYYPYAGILGLTLIILAYTFPVGLLPLQKVWMSLAIVLGYISTRIILSLLFYLVVTPIGLTARLFGKDFLDEKIQKDKKSYWNYREKIPYKKEDSERQF